MLFNIYCDESCHLPNDNSPIMVLGGIKCPCSSVANINRAIRNLKKKHNIYEFAEIKWTSVSKSKAQFFIELVDFFFENQELAFRCLVAHDKKHLDPEAFQLTYNDWYYRMYYQMLIFTIKPEHQYNIYLDIKDTNGSAKVNKLKTVLNNTHRYSFDDVVQKIALIHSDEVQIMQLADFLIGAASYSNRELSGNEAKLDVIARIHKNIPTSIGINSSRTYRKFNVFHWRPKGVSS